MKSRFLSRQIAVALLWSGISLSCLRADMPSDLFEYVNRPDANFSFTAESHHRLGAVEVDVIRLVSQEWRGLEWTHRLTLVTPTEIRHPGSAMLIVAGGSNQNERPLDFTRREAVIAAQVANAVGVAVAVLEQVPNQPLMGGLYEDDLIAHTFLQQVKTGEADWPLLFPMVKSATRAMDAVTAFLAEKHGQGPEKFLVAGASKRGWTTYLTAAVDSRVMAIAPMVFDILNLEPQLALQRASFGGFSEQIRAYEERNLFALFESPAGAALGRAVDPFTYRERLNMPKLILLGTNDPYWSVDAAGLYVQDLPGATYLYYAANTGHSLGLGIAPTLLAFVHSALAGEALPALSWTTEGNRLEVSWPAAEAEVLLWTAKSSNRDFRSATWSSRPLQAEDQRVTVPLGGTSESFTARYVEVRFPAGAGQFGLTTEIVVREATAQE